MPQYQKLPFETKREEVLRHYEEHAKARGSSFKVNTKPYHSTRSLELDVVDVDDANAFAYLVCPKQTVEFFGYGVGERITIGGTTRQATDADTNLAKAKSTNGASDFIVEGIGFHCRGFRQKDNTTEHTAAHRFDSSAVNPDVVAAIAGERPVVDPGSIYLPPQVYSPFNLENAIFTGLLGYMSVELEWDRERTEKLGAADLLPPGNAQSYLRSTGEPRSDNRWCIPEGYIWRRDGQVDSELVLSLEVREPVVIPLSLVLDPDDGDATVPEKVWLDVVARIFGMQVSLPSGN